MGVRIHVHMNDRIDEHMSDGPERQTSTPVGLYSADRTSVRRIQSKRPELRTLSAVVRAALRFMDESLARDLPGVPVASYGAPPVPNMASPIAASGERIAAAKSPQSVEDRIQGAMFDAGVSSYAAVDTMLGMAKGTTAHARKGTFPLEKAGGGKLIAWVLEQEAKRGAK